MFGDYLTVKDAVARDDVPYHGTWLRVLLSEGRIHGRRVGNQWLIYWPSLQDYVNRMEELGSKKHARRVR